MIKSPRNSYALFLASAEPNPALSNRRIIPLRQLLLNKIVQVCYLAYLSHSSLINCIVWQPKHYVACYGVVHKKYLLGNISNISLPISHIIFAYFDSVNRHTSLVWGKQTNENVPEGGFAPTRRP